MSQGKERRRTSIFSKFGKKKQEDSDEEFDATVENIAATVELDNGEDGGNNGEKTTAISRIKSKFGKMRIGKKSNGDHPELEHEEIVKHESSEECITATVDLSPSRNRSNSTGSIDNAELSDQVPGGGDEEGWVAAPLEPGQIRRRVSEVLEFESSGLEFEDVSSALREPPPLPPPVRETGRQSYGSSSDSPGKPIPGSPDRLSGSHRKLSGAKAKHWIEHKVLHKPEVVHRSNDPDEFKFAPPLEVEGDYCV